MFTGLVEKTGVIVAIHDSNTPNSQLAITRLVVDPGMNYDTQIGDSVAVNGCCLTVTDNQLGLTFDVSRETLRCTSFQSLKCGSVVNLERSLKIGDRLGGHLVMGHVDGIATVQKVLKNPDGWELGVLVPNAYARFLIEKGSICLDGVSLTVNRLVDFETETLVELMLIPTTVQLTTFHALKDGQLLNFEVDMIGKYLERLGKPWRQNQSSDS